MLEYAKAVQQSIYEQLRVVREGHLRIIFAPDLKVTLNKDQFKCLVLLLLYSYVQTQCYICISLRYCLGNSVHGATRNCFLEDWLLHK